MPLLRVVGPDGQEQRVDLTGDEYVLGRDPKTDIPLQDKKVSRRHARIFRDGDDYLVEDMGSANGVLVDGSPIRRPVPMAGAAEVEIGGFFLSFEGDPEPGEGIVFTLIGLTDPVAGQTYNLPVADIHVGRGDDSDIVVSHGSVSRNHAVLEVDVETMMVEDLGSSNGTFVNDERVAREPLQHGDMLRFGNIEFEVIVEESEAAPQPLSLPGSNLFGKLKKADSSLKLAAAMAAMTVILLVVVIALMAIKARDQANKVDPFIAYEKAVEIGLASARAQLQGESWDAAIRSYEDVLEQDPISPEARDGLIKAKVGKQHQAIINAARDDLRARNTANAIKRLASISAKSHYADQAATLLAEAKTAHANAALIKAQDACANKEWKLCHDYAVVVLTNVPNMADAQTLITTAEKKLKKKKIPYTPWP